MCLQNLHRALFKEKKWFLRRELTLVKTDENDVEYYNCLFSSRTDHYATITPCKEGARPFPLLSCSHCLKQAWIIESAGVDIEQDDREDLRYFKGLLCWLHEDTGTTEEPLSVKKAFVLYNNGCPLDLIVCDDLGKLTQLVKEHRSKGKKTSNRGKVSVYSS